MLSALKNVVLEKLRPMPGRSSALVGTAYAQGLRSPRVSGGEKRTSSHSGSKCRSYQATYSSTIARVAGCVVTSSIRPSPMTQTRRPSRNAARYSAPVLILAPTVAGLPTSPWPGSSRPPTTLSEPLVKIVPVWVVAQNQPHFPGAGPMLHIPLTLLNEENVVISLGIDEAG